MPRPKHPILVALGINIRACRRRVDLSQETLAFESGLDRTYVGGIERGERNVAVINLCRLAAALDVPPARLLRNVRWSE